MKLMKDFRRKQKVGEPFGSFHTDLLRLVETCNYHSNEKTKILRDQIVMNITSDIVREKLLEESALTLDKAVDICRSMEATGILQQALAVEAALPNDVKEFQDLFEGLGTLPGYHSIKVRQDAQPVVQPARRVPFKYRRQLEKQLNEMVTEGARVKPQSGSAL